MPLDSFVRTTTIAKQFLPETDSGLIEVYQPSIATVWDRVVSNRFNGFITDLRLKVDIQSLPESAIPNMEALSTRMERLVALRDNEWRNPRKQIDFYLKKSTTALIHVASISLLNRRPYYQIPLLSYLSDSGVFSMGNDAVLFARMTDVGFGLLLPGDMVSLWGSAREEATILPTGNDEISYSQSFGWQISSQSAVLLPPNSNRLQLTLVNSGTNRIWIAYGVQAVPGRGITLMPGGGSYEVNRTNPYKGAIAAVSENAGSTLTGLEGV